MGWWCFGGLFVSYNGANTWTKVTSYIDAGASPNISSMTQTKDNVLYVATGSNQEGGSGNGVWYSTDKGETWDVIPGTSNCTEVESSDEDNYVWLATAQGVRKWQLGETSLTTVSAGSGSCSALKVSKDGQIIISNHSNQTWVSKDGGESFSNRSGNSSDLVGLGRTKKRIPFLQI